MDSNNTSRRSVLKSIGASATAATLPAMEATASSTTHRPVVFISENVYAKYDRGDVMRPAVSVLHDALPYSVTNGADAAFERPDVSSASSLEDAHERFKDFLPSTDHKSSNTNVLIVDETKFGDIWEADAWGGSATTVAGAKDFQEDFRNNGYPNQYGDSTVYRRYWSMLIGVGLNYGCSYGQGVTYHDPSITDKNDYVRTPMILFGSGEEETTNDCGQKTILTEKIATKELRYSDCSLDTIEQNA